MPGHLRRRITTTMLESSALIATTALARAPHGGISRIGHGSKVPVTGTQ